MCTTAAVLGGKSLATQISERIVNNHTSISFLAFCFMVLYIYPLLFYSLVYMEIDGKVIIFIVIQIALSGGVLFIVFGIQSYLIVDS